jgi:hypothetical protein
MDDTAPPLAPLDAPNGEADVALSGYPHGDDGEWLSINAAARRLGVTATAIRNRIKRGTLQARPNGNFGKLVRVPPAMLPVTVTLIPREPVGVTVPLTPEGSVPLTVTLTALRDHIETLKTALARAEGELEGLRAGAVRLVGLEAQGEVLHEAAKGLRAQADEVRVDRDHWREQAQQAMQQLALPLQLMPEPQAAPQPRRPRWWWWWKRSA